MRASMVVFPYAAISYQKRGIRAGTPCNKLVTDKKQERNIGALAFSLSNSEPTSRASQATRAQTAPNSRVVAPKLPKE